MLQVAAAPQRLGQQQSPPQLAPSEALAPGPHESQVLIKINPILHLLREAP